LKIYSLSIKVSYPLPLSHTSIEMYSINSFI